ncbi:spore germination protein GerUA [Bacillus methanolicus PB1]|uniref:Spore germination protein GerUA n=1 Tax=Bacillus methanolicus PB1 TaxID=997296 RepID=I3E6Q8_BACMT|nr:spore germination protein [Bacillus methanolicus]EIJ82179.1 spore germination protein GerUA [Bacillus methanolicus PB1]
MPSFFKRKKQEKNSQEQSNKRFFDPIDYSLSANLEIIKQKTGNSSDLVIRTLKIGNHSEIRTAIIYVEGIVDTQFINDFIIESMAINRDLQEKLIRKKALEIITEEMVGIGKVKTVSDWDELFLSLMSGETIILVDGINKALSASTKGGEKRAIQDPSTQISVRGSREGFTENIRTNTAMVRRLIKNPDLWLESMTIGKITKTDVAIMYINGIAKDKIVEEVRNRLKRIDIDSILESGYIEQLIEDQTMTTFPTLYHTERPDIVAGNLLEGRIAIFVNGTPFVLLAPAVFIQFFQSVEDYYARFDLSTALRFLRILTFFISLVGPAVYISATTFHQEMIPTQLLVAIAAQREAVPFPAFVEAVIMEVSFEILREAGIRLPKAVGSAVSIVGALVIGQAAVQAGIVSPAMVIVVAITAIANFATPSFAIAISARLIRFLFMISAATFGFYGIIIGIIMMTAHLCSLRSFGVPYMSPIAPFIPANAGDTFVRVPWWALRKRPRLFNDENPVREGKNQRPQPPEKPGMVNRDIEKGDRNES